MSGAEITAAELAGLSRGELQALVDNIDTFSIEEQRQILAITEELERRAHAQKCRMSLIEFCKFIDPTYLVATHHKKLAELLEALAYGRKDRIAVSIPPRHGKSHLISTLFPAWFLGKFPDKKVLMVSHTGDLAVDFGRKVRNIIASDRYQSIFPNITLAADSKSAGRWATNHQGEYFAVGVGGAVAGRGADLLLVDDPHNEQDIINGNYEVFEKAYQWFTFGARTRLMSGGRVAIVHCMTGDTPVLMADGSEKSLGSVRPGDMVASYDHDALLPARVLNWASQGLDRIFTIKTTSGKILRANGKHPLLVNVDGELVWKKVRDLKVGMSLVGMSRSPAVDSNSPRSVSVCSQQAQKRLDCVNAARKNAPNLLMRSGNVSTIITKIVGKLKSYLSLRIGGSGEALRVVLKVANRLLRPRDCVPPTTTSRNGLLTVAAVAQTRTGTPISSTDMASVLMNTIVCSKRRTESAVYVDDHLARITHPLTGKGSWGLTTATAGEGSERYCVTPVISSSVEGTQKRRFCAPLSTYVPILDQITEITLDNYEEVFDIQVEGTENFIANGIVSHNTRWHEEDLIGQLVRDGTNNEKADQYEVFEFPAILDTESGPKALWPEKFDLDALERTKASMPVFQWNAQYMQHPTAEEAAIVKREWWRPWKADTPPKCDYVIMTLDAAAEKHNRADFTALLTFGVFSDERVTNGESHLILLNAINVRVEFPELKDLAFREYRDWEPDAFIVEKKSAGTQLYQELRRSGIPVQEFSPSRSTGDKVARLNAVADILRSGMVWYPENRRWAEEVIEQVVTFPFGSHDDMVDCVSMALSRFRQGGFIELPTDYRDPEPMFKQYNAAYYNV